VIVFLISRRFVEEPTCFDGIKNQAEEAIDCGGPCQKCPEKARAKDIIVQEDDYYVIYGGENLYDFVIKIKNPNSRYGARNFKYTVELKNDLGEVVASREGESFILPTEEKYLIEVGLESRENIALATVSIGEIDWVNFVDFEVPKINIHNQKFGLISGGKNYAEAFGLMINESPFDFNKIEINVIIRDGRNIPVAVNKTEMRTINSGEEREFKLHWPSEFPGGEYMETVEMEAEVNVFDSLNFMKKYLEGGENQSLGPSQ
jgi:hypothetical protein